MRRSSGPRRGTGRPPLHDRERRGSAHGEAHTFQGAEGNRMASSFSVKLDLGDLSAGCREGVAREGLGDSDCAVSSPGGGVWAALAAAVGWNRSDTPRSGSPRLGVQGDVADGRSDGRAGTATPHPRRPRAGGGPRPWLCAPPQGPANRGEATRVPQTCTNVPAAPSAAPQAGNSPNTRNLGESAEARSEAGRLTAVKA